MGRHRAAQGKKKQASKQAPAAKATKSGKATKTVKAAKATADDAAELVDAAAEELLGTTSKREAAKARARAAAPGRDAKAAARDATRDSADADTGDEATVARGARADAFWEEVRVDVVELALPSGVGYTLRAYRYSDELTRGTDADNEAEEAADPADEPADADADLEATELDETADPDDADPDDADPDADDEADVDDEEEDETDDGAGEDEEEEEPAEPEEVPVFLAHRGSLHLFRTPDALVAFVRSDAPHDLTQLDTWDTVRDRIRPAFVAALSDDHYELDLVVENLRGGHDAWDPPLLIGAGEIARDIGYALRLEPVLTALSPGSPLDDLDEAFRSAERGGMGSFFARRRLRRVGQQQAALAWRTIVGKISTVVAWHD